MCTGGCQVQNQLAGQLQTLCTYGATNCAQWNVAYAYLFDPVSMSNFRSNITRPPGTTLNPIATRQLTYNELLDGGSATLRSETMGYYYSYYQGSAAGSTNVFNFPTSGTTTITYPDATTSSVSTAPLCTTTRDYCPSVPYQTVNRDGSYTALGWAFPPNSNFNPYAQYALSYPTASGSPPSATVTQQDDNGNVTSVAEYDWLTGAPTKSGVFVSGLSSADTPVRTTNMSYAWSAQSPSYPYWNELGANVTYLGARTCLSIAQGSGAGSCSQSTTGRTGAFNNVYETYGYDNPFTTANLATRTQLDWTNGQNSGSGQTISSFWTYYPNGNLASATDPNGISTDITYDGQYGLYPIQVVVANGTTVQRTFHYTFDLSSGLEHTQADDNSIATTFNYDNLGRPLSAQQTGGTLTRTASTAYDDVNLGVTITNPDSVSATTYYDALGRVRYATSPSAGIHVQKAYRYGTNGTYELASNPYSTTGDQTMGWTLIKRDPVGRTIEADSYLGSAKPGPWGTPGQVTGTRITSYAGTNASCTGFNAKVTNEANNTQINCLDGLGRLRSVQEPQTPSTSSPVITTYTYDTLNNIIGVGSQIGGSTGQSYSGCPSGLVRCFTFSTLSRLLTAINPESETTSYVYDANGNLRSRTDANWHCYQHGI